MRGGGERVRSEGGVERVRVGGKGVRGEGVRGRGGGG